MTRSSRKVRAYGEGLLGIMGNWRVVCALLWIAAGLVAQPSKGDESLASVMAAPKKVLTLSSGDAVRLAIRNNLDLRSDLLSEAIQRARVVEALSKFDPTFFADFNGGKNESLFASNFPLDPTNPNSPTVTSIIANQTDSLRGDMGFRGLLESGTSYDLMFQSAYRYDKSGGGGLSPIYTSQMSLNVSQPILRNAWRMYQGAGVEQARIEAQRQYQGYRQTVTDKISQVQNAYYDLVFAREDLELKRQSVELASQQMANTQVLVDTGSLARTEVTVTRSNLAQRRAELITAEANLEAAEDTLRRQILTFENESDWEVRVIPSEQVSDEFVELRDLNEILRLAEHSQPALLQARLDVASREVSLQQRESESKPKLDLTGSLSVTGLQDDLYRSWQGAYGSDGALNWNVGLAFEYPLGNRAAESRLHQAELGLRQARIGFHNQRTELAFQVRNRLRDLRVARRSATARQEARTLAEEQLSNERLRLSLGESTNFAVFQTEDVLRQRQADEIRARLDYRLAVLGLGQVTALPISALIRSGDAASVEATDGGTSRN